MEKKKEELGLAFEKVLTFPIDENGEPIEIFKPKSYLTHIPRLTGAPDDYYEQMDRYEQEFGRELKIES